MKLFLVIFATLFYGNAQPLLAHPGDANSPSSYFECDPLYPFYFDIAYPDMVEDLPIGLGSFAELMCFGNGQAIIARPDWSWRYTGSFFDSPYIPAGVHDGLDGIAPPFYFTNITVENVSEADSGVLIDSLEKQVVTFRPNVVTRVSKAYLTDNHKNIIEVVVAYEDNVSGWLLVCAPSCRPEYVILFEKR